MSIIIYCSERFIKALDDCMKEFLNPKRIGDNPSVYTSKENAEKADKAYLAKKHNKSYNK